MRRLGIYVAAVVLAFAFGAELGRAANFTIDLTAAQVATIQWKWDQLDPSHTRFSTAQLFFADAIQSTIEEWDGQKAVADKTAFCVAFRAANTTARNNACAAIGQAAGCNPCQK